MKTYRVAFYGKGGIGKSTIACNTTAFFSMQGKRVLHIGCDPKADSTRILCRKPLRTVLELLGEKEEVSTEELIFQLENGICCVESGGPEAGNGCAGLGILTAMQELKSRGILERKWDVILYDVLGDVVCGGFSAPMRQKYVDQVFVVSSVEFMSLYAANNILKGICRYSGEKNLFGGFIFNHIHGQEEKKIAELFCQRVNGKSVAFIYEDRKMREMDFLGELYVKKNPEGENYRSFEKITEAICGFDGKKDFLEQGFTPMNKEEMESFRKEIIQEFESYKENKE